MDASQFHISILGRAERDIDDIYRWIKKRSPDGATRWYAEFLKSTASLAKDPERCGLAVEHSRIGVAIREQFFRTPAGRAYRIIFLIVEREVRILRVRGPGQAPLRSARQLE